MKNAKTLVALLVAVSTAAPASVPPYQRGNGAAADHGISCWEGVQVIYRTLPGPTEWTGNHYLPCG